jgi:exonuclease VII large subunit
MPPKKTAGPGAALQPLDVNQETLREARSQKRRATSPTPQEELEQEIRDLEAIHQQVRKKKENMLRLANLQRKIDEAAEEMRHLTQDDQDRRPQHRELRQDNPYNDDEWYYDFHHGNFAFDDASPLSTELQATPWPPSYKPPQLPMYDGHSDSKQFLMSYEATISSYGDNTAVMAKSFVMAVKSVAQTWYSSLRLGTITSWQKLKDMLITSFQGFQMKPVTAQALFQCTQDHEEYLQAYVRRFLRLRAQAPTVPNEILIEAMIKGLRPGPTA